MKILFAFLYPIQPNEQRTLELYTNLFFDDPHDIDFIRNKKGELWGYWNGLKSAWGKDDLIIIEGDNVPTIQDIYNLRDCIYDDCSCKQVIYPKHTGLDKVVLAQRIVTQYKEMRKYIISASWINGNEKFCDLVPLGCTKISLNTQNLIKEEFFKEPKIWRNLDHEMSMLTFKHGIKWHIHPEVEHDQEGKNIVPQGL